MNTATAETGNILKAVVASMEDLTLTKENFINQAEAYKFYSAKAPSSSMINGCTVPFTITLNGEGFIGVHDGDIDADCAYLAFEVLLTNCSYSHKEGYQWQGSNGYIINSGIYEPNFLIYNNGEPLNCPIEGDSYAGGLTAIDDVKNSKLVIKDIFERTPHQDIVDCFKYILGELNLS